MKLLVLKIGARIAKTGTSGGSGEAVSIIDMLSPDNEVTCYTKILKNDIPIDNVKMLDIEENYENLNYDALVIINGHCNFFGGAENRLDMLNYHIINNFKNKIFYIYCDVNLSLKQIWKSVEVKPWAHKYKKENVYITREDIIYICQAYDLKSSKELVEKNGIKIKEYFHYPLYKFPLMYDREKIGEHQVDLIYGGTFRSGKREKKLVKYYFGYQDLDVEIFGKIKLDDFKPKLIEGLKPPKFTNAVNYYEFKKKMSTGLATCIIGDNWYEGKHLTQRIYEGILGNSIIFIDKDLDPYQMVFKNQELKNHCYVNSRQEVEDRIKDIKKNNSYLQIVDAQFNDTIIDKRKFCSDFSKLIYENLL